MAVGFTPKYQTKFSIEDLSSEQFFVFAMKAIKRLGWEISYVSKTGIIAYTTKGMFAAKGEVTIKIENSIASVCSASTGTEMIDFGKNKKYVETFLENFYAVKSELAHDDTSKEYEELKSQIVSQEDDFLAMPPPTKVERIKNFFSFFIPQKGFFVTPLLVDINIILFILMVSSGVNILLPDNESLIKWGANFKPITLEGEWWRLFTCIFLHIGIVHLLMNMYALIYIGILLEPLLGRIRFLSAYILTGIVASITSLWWHDITISAGASGAIFGMYGVFLALLTTNFIEKNTRKSLLTSIAVFIGYNLLYGMKQGIDNAAHIGGLISGATIGYIFVASLRNEGDTEWKYGTIGASTILVFIVSIFVYKNTTNDIGRYESEMKRFISMESMALEVYKLPQNTPKEQLLYGLNDRGIYYWEENIELLDELDKLNLPEDLHQRNTKLKRYCQLRIESYELIVKGIKENTDRYQPQIEAYNKSIQEILNEFNK